MLFQKNIVKKFLASLPEEPVAEAWNRYQAYFLDPNMTKYLPFCHDETGAICNDKAFIITSKDNLFCPELGEDRRSCR